VAILAAWRDRRERSQLSDDLAGARERAALLAEAGERIAHRKARAMRKELAVHNEAIDGSRSIRFTASIGVAAWTRGDTPAALLARADQALYAAKRGGRNRAVRAG
jgi:diguanylate cyclase (GGDEF)-like protein